MKKVVKMFTMCPKKERRLRAIQTSKNEKVIVGLLKFSGTRWNGAYMALGRLYRLQSYLIMYFNKYEEDKSFEITNYEWTIIPQVLAILDKVNDFTKKLQYKEVSLTAYKYIFINELIKHFEDCSRGVLQTLVVDHQNIKVRVRV